MNDGEAPDVLRRGPLGRACRPTALLSHSAAVTPLPPPTLYNSYVHNMDMKCEKVCNKSPRVVITFKHAAART